MPVVNFVKRLFTKDFYVELWEKIKRMWRSFAQFVKWLLKKIGCSKQSDLIIGVLPLLVTLPFGSAFAQLIKLFPWVLNILRMVLIVDEEAV